MRAEWTPARPAQHAISLGAAARSIDVMTLARFFANL